MQYLPWILLLAHVTTLLCLDIFVFSPKNEVKSKKSAIYETLFFIFNALAFSGIIFWIYGTEYVDNINHLSPTQSVVKFITGYLIELSLSVDNLFVIAILFASYKIPTQYQHRLLFLGILGAIVFRALLIGAGLMLVHKIHSITIFFGLFLLYTAFKMLKKEDESSEVKEPKGLSKLLKVTKIIDGNKFTTQHNGKRVFTALFGALISIEVTDLLFALDSIPAIFAVTTDPFLVFSSNIFAIMGLRSMYFFLANMLDKFSYLKYSVFSILLFVALKLIVSNWFTFPEWFSLLFIALALGAGVWASILKINKSSNPPQ